MPARLIDELIRRTALEESHRSAIFAEQSRHGGCIDTAILELKLVSEGDLMPALGAAYGFATAEPSDTTQGIESNIFRRFPEQLAVKHGWAPLEFSSDETILKILCTAPPKLKAMREVGQVLDLKLKPVLTTEVRVQQRQALLYNRTPEKRFIELLNAGGGLGNEVIHAPTINDPGKRSSLLPTQPLTFAEATRQLLEAKTRDEVVEIALFYAHRSFSYVGLLATRQGKLHGWKAIGSQAEKIQGLEIDPKKPSSFAIAYETTAQVLGPPKTEDRPYLQHLARENTRSLLLVPMRMGERTFAMFYADHGSAAIAPHFAAEMMVFAHHVQQAMERIILQQREQSDPKNPESVLPIPPLAEASVAPKSKETLTSLPIHQRPTSSVSLKPKISLTPEEPEAPKTTQAEPKAKHDTGAEDHLKSPEKENEEAWEAQLDDALREQKSSPPNSDTDPKEQEVENAKPTAPTPRATSQSGLPPFSLPALLTSRPPAETSPPKASAPTLSVPAPRLPTPPSLSPEPEKIERREPSARMTSSPLLQSAPPVEIAGTKGPSGYGLRQASFETESEPKAPPVEFSSPKEPSGYGLRQASFEVEPEPEVPPKEPAPVRQKSAAFLEMPPPEAKLKRPKSAAFLDTPVSFPDIKAAKALPDFDAPPSSQEQTGEPKAKPLSSALLEESAVVTLQAPTADQSERLERPEDEIEAKPKEPHTNTATEDLAENDATWVDEEPVALVPREPSFTPQPPAQFSEEDYANWTKALTSEDALTRKHALDSEIAKDETVLPLIKPLFPGVLDVDPSTAGAALPRFSKCGSLLKVLSEFGATAHPYVEGFVDSSEMKERFFATYFYAECHVPEMIPRLIRRLHDGDPRISAAAVSSLKQYKNEDAFKMVIKHLHERMNGNSIEAKKRAIECLGTFRDVSAVEPLIGILERQEKSTLQFALLALEEITRQSWGLNVRKWRGWWNKHLHQSRTEWLVLALESKDLNVREASITELEELHGERKNYVAAGARRPRSKAVSNWKKWVKDHDL